MKQKLFTLLFAVAASVGTLFAESGTCGSNLTWVLSNGILAIHGTGDMKNYAEVAPWYMYSGRIKALYIEDGVTSIGNNAFYNCIGLTIVNIPSSVTKIGNYAFQECTGLTSVTIVGNSVTSIGKGAFYGCTGLTSVTIPNSVTSIGDNAFYRCTSLPVFDNLRYADTYLIEAVDKTQSTYNIKDGTRYIGASAFKNCTGLTSIEIPNSVSIIGDDAFYGCSGLTSVTLNSHSIVGRSYSSNSNIKNFFGSQVTEYIIGDSVTSIGNYAFYNCSNLTSVTIPNSVTDIGDDAFDRCTNLPIIDNLRYADTYLIEAVDKTQSTYIIKDGTRFIGTYAFSGCSGITSVIWNARNCNTCQFGSQVESFVFGESVEVIPANLCAGMTLLTSITIPHSVTSIEENAFSGCSGITSVIWNAKNCNTCQFGSQVESFVFGESVEVIPANLCAGMTLLTSITIPHSVTSIGYKAFQNCTGLSSIEIPNSVTSIEYGAFWGCNGLTSVTCYATTPPVLGDNIFYSVDCSQKPLYVPNESVAQYRKTYQWKDFDVKPLNPFNCLVNASASHGIVEGAGEYEFSSKITLKVIPEEGSVFQKWSDGDRHNPRTITIWQDTTLTAICKERQVPANTVNLPYNEPFTSNIGKFSISDVNADGLNYIWKWANADYGMKASAYASNTSHATESWLISPPISLMNASNIVLSFQHAVNKGTPSNQSVKISTDLGTTWSNLPVSNWPAGSDWTFISASESLDAYADNIVQIAFVYVSTSSDCPTWEVKNVSITGTVAAVEPMPITVDASETTAAVSWLQVFNGVTYELIIYGSNWNVIYVMVFDSEGHLLNITNDAPARDKSSQQEQTGGFAYTIAGLNSGTEYNYMLVAKDNTDKMITSYSGSFKTTGNTTALEEVDDHLLQSNPTQCTKVLRNGQIFILRGDKIYNAQGALVK